MSQNTLIVSNWKMNLNFTQAQKLINNFGKISLKNRNIKNIICPQFLLMPFVSKLINRSDILLGAQDCHFMKSGSFTGDSSIELIKEMNCKYIIIGHSERRQFHFETDDLIRKKMELILSENLKPILCIGESINERKSNNHLKIIKNQLKICVPNYIKEIIIAYEPIWSIGSGIIPTINEIIEIQETILDFLRNTKKIKKILFLYGGSVDSTNFKFIMKNTNVNGFLIGSASLKFKEMNKILTFS